VKHLFVHSYSLVTLSAAPASVQQVVLANRGIATDLRVEALSSRMAKLESTFDLSSAVFAEEQDGRINEE